MKKSLLAMVLAVILLLPVTAYGVELDLQAPSALLMEKTTGEILYAKDEHHVQPPASVTKIMTLLLTMEAIDNGTIHYDDMVTVSAYASSMGGSQVFLTEGEQISVEDLIKSVCVSSGNDAAVALAEYVGGVTELFVEKMNNRAKELGMKDTHFINPTGLPAEGHVTSAYDIALMSRELILKHPDIRRYTTIWMDTIRGGTFGLSNTNKLIRFYDGATGLKTGFTTDAGYCISATAEKDGMELIAVIMKGETAAKRNEDAKTLLNYGFSTYALVDATPEDALGEIPVTLGVTDSVAVALPEESQTLLVEKSKVGSVERKVKLSDSLPAPVKKGDKVGELVISVGDEKAMKVPLQAAQSVDKLSWGDLCTRLLKIAFLAE